MFHNGEHLFIVNIVNITDTWGNVRKRANISGNDTKQPRVTCKTARGAFTPNHRSLKTTNSLERLLLCCCFDRQAALWRHSTDWNQSFQNKSPLTKVIEICFFPQCIDFKRRFSSWVFYLKCTFWLNWNCIFRYLFVSRMICFLLFRT